MWPQPAQMRTTSFRERRSEPRPFSTFGPYRSATVRENSSLPPQIWHVRGRRSCVAIFAPIYPRRFSAAGHSTARMEKPPRISGRLSWAGSAHYRVVQIVQRPKLIDHASSHRRRHLQAAVNADEVVMGDVEWGIKTLPRAVKRLPPPCQSTPP